MTYNNETALAENNDFVLPAMIENEFSSEDLAEDYEGLQMHLQRIKIPSGGGRAFEIPGDDPDNPRYESTLQGVIIYNHPACAYWPEGADEDDNVPPICSSVDGKLGIGTPGGSCALCELNKFGTDGKGKACKNMRHLYILRRGEFLPIFFALPPTSLRPFNDFMSASFVSRRRPTWGSLVEIGLRRIEGATPYSIATFKKLRDFSGDELAQLKQYADTFREQIKMMLQQRAADSETRIDEESMYETDSRYSTVESGEHFEISRPGAIDGEREVLPA